MLGTRSRRWLFASIPAALATAAGVAFAAAGSLDPFFGTGGVVQIPVTELVAPVAAAAVVQPDGKVVVGGRDEGPTNVAWHWRVRRLLSDGAPDTGFGTAGQVVLFGASTSHRDRLCDVALDGVGRILAVGAHGAGGPTPTVVRLNADGSLDSSFGVGGVSSFAIPGAYASGTARAVAIQPDGKIVVAGTVHLVAKKTKKDPDGYQNARFAVRLHTDGSLDATFGVGGICVNDLTTGDDAVRDRCLGLQSDGSIVLGGDAGGTQPGAISRIRSNGTVDTGFGPVGMTFVPMQLAVDVWDRALVSGTSGVDAVVARYTASGGVDASFGVNGKTTFHDPLYTTAGYGGLAVRPDGRVRMVTRVALPSSQARIRPVGLLDNGQLDAAFGTGGLGDPITVAVGLPQDLALASDGACFIVGSLAEIGVPFSQKWFVARYLAD